MGNKTTKAPLRRRMDVSDEDQLIIILHIFSGIPPPMWKIKSDDPSYQNIINMAANQSTPLVSQLGYAGFTIQIYTGGVLVNSLDVGRRSNKNLETLLINVVEHRIPERDDELLGDELVQIIRDEIDKS